MQSTVFICRTVKSLGWDNIFINNTVPRTMKLKPHTLVHQLPFPPQINRKVVFFLLLNEDGEHVP